MPLDLFHDSPDPGPPGPPDPTPPVTPPVRGTHDWQILARDGAYIPRAEVDDYKTLSFVSRWNTVGTHTLTIPATAAAVPILLGQRAGIIVLRDGEVVYSGPTRSKLRTSKEGERQLVTSGVDDMFWLAARLAHPEPDQPAPTADKYGPNVYDTRTGICSTVLHEYVDVNVGPGAIARRQDGLPVVMAADLGLGDSVTGNGRWQPLLTLLQRLAINSDPTVTFRLQQSDINLLFQTSLPADLSSSVVFAAEAGTLGDYEIELAGGTANYIYGLGSGAEENRLVAEAENGADVDEWGLVEAATDHRDIGGTATLRQTAAGEIKEQAGTFRTDLNVIDTAGLQWRRDWNLGDRVGVTVDGITLTELVREVQVDLGAGDTEKVTPSVASPSRRTSVRQSAVFAELRDLRARLSHLERNQ